MKLYCFLGLIVSLIVGGCEGVDGAILRNGSTVFVEGIAYTVGPMAQRPNLYAARFNGPPIQSIHLGHAQGRVKAIEVFTGCEVNPLSIAVLNGMVTTAEVACR